MILDEKLFSQGLRLDEMMPDCWILWFFCNLSRKTIILDNLANNELLTKFTSSFHSNRFIKWLELFNRFTRVNTLRVLAHWLLPPLKYWQSILYSLYLAITLLLESFHIRFTFAQERRWLLSARWVLAFWSLPRQYSRCRWAVFTLPVRSKHTASEQ